ncbi:anti-repressor SinI family protein [Alkalicoccobacillus plakortidis]|uniref:Anti-repressor SinI family protein n=1 Tax=Alkalicoccobacillus plakortidis TaxID=444060 RepID=A0ABT0XLK2_9BACI|nr:anti-repressor SinI family protein [Alkalicoccobacillus plakortidis]MCM2676077.1 anti-repressor SinI family protein [Alkalicoccobacillus plakortidis]
MFGICDKNDQEWLHLIREAKRLGLTVKEIKQFIYESKKKNHNLFYLRILIIRASPSNYASKVYLI